MWLAIQSMPTSSVASVAKCKECNLLKLALIQIWSKSTPHTYETIDSLDNSCLWIVQESKVSRFNLDFAIKNPSPAPGFEPMIFQLMSLAGIRISKLKYFPQTGSHWPMGASLKPLLRSSAASWPNWVVLKWLRVQHWALNYQDPEKSLSHSLKVNTWQKRP